MLPVRALDKRSLIAESSSLPQVDKSMLPQLEQQMMRFFGVRGELMRILHWGQREKNKKDFAF